MKVIAKVDTGFLRKWILTKKLSGQTQGGGGAPIGRNIKTRGAYDLGQTQRGGGTSIGRGIKTLEVYDVADTTILDLYNSFNRALKDFNFTGDGNSAEDAL